MNNERTNDDPAKENAKDSQVRLDTYSQVMACLAAEFKRLGVDIKPEKGHRKTDDTIEVVFIRKP